MGDSSLCGYGMVDGILLWADGVIVGESYKYVRRGSILRCSMVFILFLYTIQGASDVVCAFNFSVGCGIYFGIHSGASLGASRHAWKFDDDPTMEHRHYWDSLRVYFG